MFARSAYLISAASKLTSKILHTSANVTCPCVIKMPNLSPTMTEGEIIQWYKKEGDEILAGDPLCQVKTDKAAIDYDQEEEGILAKIIQPDHSVNEVNSPIGIIAFEDENWEEINKNWQDYVKQE